MWTQKHLDALLKAGKIKAYKANEQTKNKVVKKVTRYAQGEAAKAWIDSFLQEWTAARGLSLRKEFPFHPTRKWRFDFAIEDRKLAVEYEGLLGWGRKTGHTDSKGYTANTDKYNAAAALGWMVIRVTFLNYMTLAKTFTDIEKNQSHGTIIPRPGKDEIYPGK